MREKRGGMSSWMALLVFLALLPTSSACGGAVTPRSESASTIEEKEVTADTTLQLTTEMPARPKPAKEDFSPTPSENTVIHSVQPGETLDIIAKKYGITVETLVTLNSVEDPDLIRVGQELAVGVSQNWATTPEEEANEWLTRYVSGAVS